MVTTRKSTSTTKKPARTVHAKHTTKETPVVHVARSVTKKRVRRTYAYAVGRRKSAIARVRRYDDGNGEIVVNGKPVNEYFPVFAEQLIVRSPLELTGHQTRGRYSIKCHGGGKRGQAEATRHGIARVLVMGEPTLRTTLKKNGMLRRDARVKERKKYGLKRARRAPQWQKR